MLELEKLVSGLNEKLKEKKGEIVFCLREFQFSGEEKGFSSPQITNISYYEAGIINGELQKHGQSATERIKFPASFFERDNLEKNILGEYSINVNKKFKGFFMHDFHKNFQFEIKDLEEQLKQGQLYMNSAELAKAFYFQGIFYPGSKDLDLKDFHIAIGDKKVEDFMKEKKIENYQEFFKILKNSAHVEDIIIKHYNDEGERIAKKLVIRANEIANNFREIQSLELSVMNAHLIEDWDADGKRMKVWDKEGLVNKYFLLKRLISQKIEKGLNRHLEVGDKLSYASFLINGEIIGFPGEVSFVLYSHWLKNKLIPEINKTFEKIDGYLEKEKNMALEAQ